MVIEGDDFNNINEDDSNNSKESEINLNNSFFSTDNNTCCNFEFLYNFYTNNSKNNVKIEKKPTNNDNYTKTIIHELSKYEVDEKVVKIIEEVAQKIDNDYLGEAINNSPKTVTVINYFSCYMVEFTPDMLQTIEPKYKDILQNYCIKFIVLAKELYNTTMELFCSMYDLSYNKVERFVDLAGGCGIQLKNATGLYKVFKDYSIILLEKGSFNDLKKTVEKFVEKEKVNWDKVINQFSDKFPTYFQG